jgi:hypothetical protein
MNIVSKTFLTVALALAAPNVIACQYPSRPDTLPNGATASKEEMIEGVKTINTYQTAMDEYLTCIEADYVVALQGIPSDDKKARKQRKEMFNKKYNAAVDEQTLWVEEFNTQIRAYKDSGD